MTTREIAELVGKTERVVQMWAKRSGEKISSIGEKISSAGHGLAADYTLEETITILREGKISESLISLLTENARRGGETSAEIAKEEIALIVRETVSAMLPAIVAAIRETAPRGKVPARPALPAPPRKTILDLRYPVEHAEDLASAIWKEAGWIVKQCPALEIQDHGFDLEEAYLLFCRAKGLRVRTRGIYSARNRERAIREHVGAMVN